MEISLSELIQVSEKIFDHIRELGAENIEIPIDFYWDIPSDHRFNVYKEPESKVFTIGQIEDDWAELQKLLDEKIEPKAISYQLVWLSSILRTIGEQIVL